jgi:hypothetical protein
MLQGQDEAARYRLCRVGRTSLLHDDASLYYFFQGTRKDTEIVCVLRLLCQF